MSGTKPTPGVTITLTGDASDSVVTDANGEFSFDLPDGSYVLTPSKDGHQFSPASANVEVSGADDTDNDFTDEGIYTLSGTITDAESSGLGGVTITLTGDASDSTTTAADGTYSFTLPDGSYTVTPTLEEFAFSPEYRNVNVSGDDVSVDNMEDTGVLHLPFTLNIGSFQNGTLNGVDGFEFVVDKYGDGVSDSSGDLTDANSYTPSGVTKVAKSISSGSDHLCTFLFPYGKSIQSGLSTLRFAMLIYISSNQYSQIVVRDTARTSAISNAAIAIFDTSGNQDTYDVKIFTGGAEDATAGKKEGGNRNSNRWFWVCGEIDTDGTQHSRAYRVEDGDVHTADFSISLASIPRFNRIGINLYGVTKSCDYYLAGVWVGGGSDAWPTDAIPGTTIEWPV
jgi:hypothetical protein